MEINYNGNTSLNKNYLSVSATTRLGAAVMFEDGELSFIDPERVGCGEIFPEVMIFPRALGQRKYHH